jgi:hypothetical protein
LPHISYTNTSYYPHYTFEDTLAIHDSYCGSDRNQKIIHEALVQRHTSEWLAHLNNVIEVIDKIFNDDLKEIILDYYYTDMPPLAPAGTDVVD